MRAAGGRCDDAETIKCNGFDLGAPPGRVRPEGGIGPDTDGVVPGPNKAAAAAETTVPLRVAAFSWSLEWGAMSSSVSCGAMDLEPHASDRRARYNRRPRSQTPDAEPMPSPSMDG